MAGRWANTVDGGAANASATITVDGGGANAAASLVQDGGPAGAIAVAAQKLVVGTKGPNLPALGSKVDGDVRRAFDALKGWFANTGKFISVDDLVGTGLVSNAGSGVTPTLPYLDTAIPPKIVGFTVTGAFNSILLKWDDPRYRNLGYVEVYRAEVDDLGVAVRIGTTVATMYADTPPDSSLSVTYYYWVRIVSAAGIEGPYNDTHGTAGTTANDPAYLIEVLSNELGKVTPTPSVPDLVYAVNRFALKMGKDGDAVYPFIVAEIPENPGYYAVFIDTAFIKTATITDAMIADLKADKLTVPGTASIWDAIITTGKITNAYIGDTIQSTVYVPGPTGTGWKIDKTGTIRGKGLEVEDASVTTLKIGTNAVTVSAGSNSTTASIDAEGQPVMVMVDVDVVMQSATGINWGVAGGTITLYRDGSPLRSYAYQEYGYSAWTKSYTILYKDTASSGSHTYSVTATHTITACNLFLTGLKR